MKASIDDYEGGRVSLERLAWVLKSRVAGPRGLADDGCFDQLKTLWNQFEYVNALFVESRRSHLTPDEHHEIVETSNEIRAALVAY